MQKRNRARGIEFLFWLAGGIIAYTFFGYPLLVGYLARKFAQPHRQAGITPSVTLLIPAYNEAAVLAAKIENSLTLDYPAHKLAILVVADGSDDDTVAVAQQYANRGVQVTHQPQRRGKASAINRVMPGIDSEIVVLTDANAMLAPGTLRAMARHFADSHVAAVAGEKQVRGGGEGLYWRYESFLKRQDSALSSVMGAAGELFAIRRTLYTPPEPDSIIEDFVTSMRLVEEGWRVIYEPKAVAQEKPTSSLEADWQRRVRIAAGGFQSIVRMPGLLHPRHGRVWWQYASHRVLRWAAAPFLLPLVFVLNWILAKGSFYRLLAIGQSVFYGVALLGYRQARRGYSHRLLTPIFYFCFSNLAALAGFWRYVTKSQPVTWVKVH